MNYFLVFIDAAFYLGIATIGVAVFMIIVSIFPTNARPTLVTTWRIHLRDYKEKKVFLGGFFGLITKMAIIGGSLLTVGAVGKTIIFLSSKYVQ